LLTVLDAPGAAARASSGGERRRRTAVHAGLVIDDVERTGRPSGALGLAEEHSTAIRAMLRSPIAQEVWPHLKRKAKREVDETTGDILYANPGAGWLFRLSQTFLMVFGTRRQNERQVNTKRSTNTRRGGVENPINF
jgi:hypothetical protein